MKNILLNGRKVVDIEVSIEKYGVDSFIQSAIFDDSGKLLNEDELEELQELYPEIVIDAFTEARGYYSK